VQLTGGAGEQQLLGEGTAGEACMVLIQILPYDEYRRWSSWCRGTVKKVGVSGGARMSSGRVRGRGLLCPPTAGGAGFTSFAVCRNTRSTDTEMGSSDNDGDASMLIRALA
jgi:hypothetical protein